MGRYWKRASPKPDRSPRSLPPVPRPKAAAPESPRPVATPVPRVPVHPAATVPRVVEKSPQPAPLRPVPEREVAPVPRPPQYVPKPAARPAAATARESTPDPAPIRPAPVRKGLSLRFESDAVLRSLVERRLVGLYAIQGNDFLEMSVTGGQVRFAAGAAPAQYHQMVFETVPGDVLQDFEVQHGLSSREVTWGVTLPAATTSQLRRFVQTNYEGSLVITAQAGLALAE